MKDILPSLFLLLCGGYFWWTASQPDHAQPKTARVVAAAFGVVGVGALIYSIIQRLV